jgi:hypothetical protein
MSISAEGPLVVVSVSPATLCSYLVLSKRNSHEIAHA